MTSWAFLDVYCSIGSKGAALEAQLLMGADLTRNVNNCRYICTIFSIFFMFSGKVLAKCVKHFTNICNIQLDLQSKKLHETRVIYIMLLFGDNFLLFCDLNLLESQRQT